MEYFLPLLQVLFGFLVLLISGKFLVDTSVWIAKWANLSPAVIGLTIVAVGTSMPELVVSLLAAYNQQSDIALANVIGSNIANIGLVLGLTTILLPIPITGSVTKIEWPVLFFLTLFLAALTYDGTLGSFDGIILLTIMVAFTFYMIKLSKKDKSIIKEEDIKLNIQQSTKTIFSKKPLFQFFILILCFFFLFMGGNFTVKGAVSLAQMIGISERVIGLTIVAIGTSLPELITSLIAAYKKQDEIAIGNILGSNFYNIALILGTSASIFPIHVSNDIYKTDGLIMLCFLIVIFPVMFFIRKIPRSMGVFLVLSYLSYLGYLIT